MMTQSIAAGFTGIRRRPGLVVLLYGMNLALAFVLAVPVYVALGSTVGATGFSADLARDFDIVLWADVIEEAGEALAALQFQLLWMIPLYLVWKAAAGVGLVHALRGDRVRSFWQGVGRYTGRAVGLALLFLLTIFVGLLALVVVVALLSVAWPGEVGAFWINFVAAPTLVISLLAVLDLMHDYARIALVVDDEKVLRAWTAGIRWPLRHGRASWLYVAWFVPAALLLLLPTLLDATVAAATGGAIWGLFLIQQLVLLLRAAVTVGWIGSETAFYETLTFREMPLIAVDEQAPPVASDEMLGSEPGGLASA